METKVRDELEKARYETVENEIEDLYHQQYLVRMQTAQNTTEKMADSTNPHKSADSIEQKHQHNWYGAVELGVKPATSEITGPFQVLAFIPTSAGLQRVKITPQNYNNLMRFRVLCGLLGVFIFAFAIVVTIGSE